jgi:hypothetical protein
MGGRFWRARHLPDDSHALTQVLETVIPTRAESHRRLKPYSAYKDAGASLRRDDAQDGRQMEWQGTIPETARSFPLKACGNDKRTSRRLRSPG